MLLSSERATSGWETSLETCLVIQAASGGASLLDDSPGLFPSLWSPVRGRSALGGVDGDSLCHLPFLALSPLHL